jgi:3-phosphoshikimate 1-carboxyvinyltransferase
MQETITIQPIDKVDGIIDLPGSKSISNRVLLLAAISSGKTILRNLLDSDDTRHMLNALVSLGIICNVTPDCNICEVVGGTKFLDTENEMKLHVGNAGTVMRFLTAMLSLGRQNILLTGEARMWERPIRDLVDALRQGGAEIAYLGNKGYPPLRLKGGFKGGDIGISGCISSQFITSLLMMAPMAERDTVITIYDNLTSKPYVDMTLHLMRCFGISIEHENYQKFIIRGQQNYSSPRDYLIEGDASSMSYFLAAAAVGGGTIRVNGIGRRSFQGDIGFVRVLEHMGARVDWGDGYISCTPPYSEVLRSIDMDMNHLPDSAMTSAILGLFSEGKTVIRNIYNWRVKETDRLLAMATELVKVGARVKEGRDYISIIPPEKFSHATINTYKDHRMAMCFSLVALSGIPVTITDPCCVRKTFPNYFRTLEKIIHIS